MSRARKTSTVVFYQPDEEAVLSWPGEDPEEACPPTPEVVTSSGSPVDAKITQNKKRPSLSIIKKNTESEDSGVRSVSNDEDDTTSLPSRSSKKSLRFSRKFSTCSSLWDFPSFDELFENGGQTRLAFHRSPTSISDIIPRSPTSTSSFDSGVRSVSNDEDDTTSLPSRSSKKSLRFSRKFSTCSSLWDFPSFDELFENGGQTRLAFHRSPTSISDIIPRSPTSTSSFGESAKLEEESLGSGVSGKPSMDHRQSITSRQDSLMAQSFKEVIFKSWEGCHDFASFRRRLGSSVHHKYCMCCRINSMPFVFFHVAVGMFITCIGVLCFIHCRDELMLSIYVLVNGLLSVFFFPTLIMAWNKRVGGCVVQKKDEEVHKEGPAFWIVTLVCRIIATVTGSVILAYRWFWIKTDWENDLCLIQYFTTFGVVVLEWIFLILFLLIPIIIYFIIYRLAPSLTEDLLEEKT